MAPSNVTIEFVENPSERLTEEATDIIASAMPGDPCAIALTGGNMTLLADFGRTMTRSLALTPRVSHMFTARDDTGALVGFTLFALPGELMFSTEEQREKGRVADYMSKLSPEGQEYFAGTMGQDVPKANDEVLGIEAAERNTYWCNLAMVRPDYQGKGICKAMFQLAYKEAAKTGATVALTTTNIINIPKYEGIGLDYRGERKFPSPWGEWSLYFFARATKEQDSLA